jgi:hypothetical protein
MTLMSTSPFGCVPNISRVIVSSNSARRAAHFSAVSTLEPSAKTSGSGSL